MIFSLTDDPSGKFAHQFGGGSHKPEIRTAEREGHTERLTLADCDVRTDFRGSGKQAQRERLDAKDQRNANGVRCVRRSFGICMSGL